MYIYLPIICKKRYQKLIKNSQNFDLERTTLVRRFYFKNTFAVKYNLLSSFIFKALKIES
jgi:hypothetical protein